jgi:hypothetical protein
MIIRLSILWAIGFSAAYHLFAMIAGSGLESRAEPFFASRNEWRQMGLARARRILNADLTGQDVYIGTSLGDKLDDVLLPRPFQKFTLIGGSPLTGLAILEKSGQRPRRVFIESNYLLTRSPDKKIVKKSTGWRGMTAPTGMPVLHVAYRPVDLLLISAFSPQAPPALSGAALEQRRRELMAFPGQSDSTPVDPETVRKTMEVWGGQFLEQPDPVDSPLLHALKRMVSSLESRGVEIVFFRMPVDPGVTASGYYSRNQAVLAEHFPAGRYLWIEPAEDFQYRTLDGFHLTYVSKIAYTRHLLAALAGRQ